LIAYVDTNILVRHLTNDPPSLANKATALLEGAEQLILPDLVMAELIYVLESYYEHPRDEIAQSGRALLALPSIAVHDHDLLLRALELYEYAKLDFAEAYLAAAAELSGIYAVASFDRSLDRLETIERFETLA
jgi:predicted nucleic acid-binding protein